VPEAAQRHDADRALASTVAQLPFARTARRHLDHGMQAGRDAEGARARSALRQHRDQPVAPRAVAPAHAPQVAVPVAGLDQLRQRQLLGERQLTLAQALDVEHGIEQGRRHREPRDPQSRREGLAGGARVHHALGVERLERAHGLAVEAELAVVVVLDHVAAGPLRPLHHG